MYIYIYRIKAAHANKLEHAHMLAFLGCTSSMRDCQTVLCSLRLDARGYMPMHIQCIHVRKTRAHEKSSSTTNSHENN